MTKTMTFWAACNKTEALAVAAERLGLPGRHDIRDEVEQALIRATGKERLAELIIDWRGRVGSYHPRTARWLDAALFDLLEYLELPEVELSGAALLDHLIDGTATKELEGFIAAASARHHLVSLR